MLDGSTGSNRFQGVDRGRLDDLARALPESRRRDLHRLHDVLRDESGSRRKDRLADILGGSADDYHDDRISELHGIFNRNSSSGSDSRRGSRGDLENLFGRGSRSRRGSSEGWHESRSGVDEMELGGVALDDLEGDAVGGARRLVRRLRVVGAGATRYSGAWRDEGWASSLGRRFLERIEDAFLKHSSAMHMRSGEISNRPSSEQPVVRIRVLPLARLDSALAELQTRTSTSGLAHWKRSCGLHEEDVLALGEFARAVVDLQRSVAAHLSHSDAGRSSHERVRGILGMS